MALTVEQITKALEAKAGNITAAAKALGVTRAALYKRMKDSPNLREVVEQERESMVDIAESALRKEVLGGNITAIIFTLKTLGKSRGYVERSEVDIRVKDVSQLSDDELNAILSA